MRTNTVIVALTLLGGASLPAKAQSRTHYRYTAPRTPTLPAFQVPTTGQLGLSLASGLPTGMSAVFPSPNSIVRTDSLVAPRRLCPMPVLRVDSSRVERMPVSVPDSNARSQMPVADLRCNNPLNR